MLEENVPYDHSKVFEAAISKEIPFESQEGRRIGDVLKCTRYRVRRTFLWV